MNKTVKFKNLKNCMDDLVSDPQRPSVDIMVCRNHQTLFRYFTGVKDIEKNNAVTGDEFYFIYSMTKMLTCACALQLLEKGKYRLDDKLCDYLPEFAKMKIGADGINPENAAKIAGGKSIGEQVDIVGNGYAKTPITIRHLFTMTAGLDYSIYCDEIRNAIAAGKATTRELVRAISEKTLGFEPGTHFRYSLCHDVLGALIEVWSGEKFGDYMKKNILDPLGMKNTFFGLPEDTEKMPALYSKYENHPFKKEPLNCVYTLTDDYQSGGAGLTSTTQDYAMFLDAVACGGVGKGGNRILKEYTIKLWKTNQLSGAAAEDFNNMRPGYGYGLGVRTHINPEISRSHSPIGEFGWDGAAGAFAMVDTDNKISLTYFQNVLGHAPDQTAIRNALYKDLEI